MSNTTHSDHDFAVDSIWQVMSTILRSLAHRSAQRRAYHSTVRELASLSDDALADAGIHRGDIQNIARGLAYAD